MTLDTYKNIFRRMILFVHHEYNIHTEQEIRDFAITDILNIVFHSPGPQLLVDPVQHGPLLGSAVSRRQQDDPPLPTWTRIFGVPLVFIILIEDAERHDKFSLPAVAADGYQGVLNTSSFTDMLYCFIDIIHYSKGSVPVPPL